MTTTRPARRWYLRLPVLLLLIALGVGQMLLALVFLRNAPTAPAEAAAAAPPAAPTEQAPAKAEHGPAAHGEHAVEAELDLGNFAMTVPPAKDHGTLLVSFHLYGTLPESEQAEFHERIEALQHRVRQEVLLAVREMSLPALTDPSLGEFKKRLLGRMNRVLGKPALRDLIFSDLAILEP